MFDLSAKQDLPPSRNCVVGDSCRTESGRGPSNFEGRSCSVNVVAGAFSQGRQLEVLKESCDSAVCKV